jgi:lipoprotein-releasing system permease protein
MRSPAPQINIRGEGLATVGAQSSFVQVYGITPDESARYLLVLEPQQSSGSIDDFANGVALFRLRTTLV